MTAAPTTAWPWPVVTVEVVDANSASVVVTPYDTGGNKPENDLLVAENPSAQGGSIPASDAYAVVLSKAPLGPVSYQTATDGQTKISSDGITWHSGANDPLTLTFTPGNWNTMQVVYVEGVNDNLKQGLHFSQVTQGVTSDAGDFLGLSATDVAKGLAAAVNGDATGRFNATVSGSTVTVTGPAFQASISGAGTQGQLAGTKGAFDGRDDADADRHADRRRDLEGHDQRRRLRLRRPGRRPRGVRPAGGDRDPARGGHHPRRPLPRDRHGRSAHGHAAGQHAVHADLDRRRHRSSRPDPAARRTTRRTSSASRRRARSSRATAGCSR